MKSVKQINNYTDNKCLIKKRVAAYCRISTEHKDQLASLKAQEEYYKYKINKNPLWEFAGIYSDKASGRSRRKRKQFNSLMLDCHNGLIDIILTKSISRFGRNTLETLVALQELKLLGVNVIFEVEKTNLFNRHSDLIITIYAALYQSESERKSSNIKWGIERSFENTQSKYLKRKCFGYCHGIDAELIIEPTEAEFVKNIFLLYLEGKSLRQLINWLEQTGIKSPMGKKNWSVETVNKILSNEKYTGNVLLQKTFVKNYFDGKQCINRGQKSQYYISNTNPTIINQEVFNKVQEEKTLRGNRRRE